MKGQTQIMSAVLLTGIMIGLISVAYIWGGPMIQKQKDVVKLDDMESFMRNLDKEIRNVAKNGGTTNLNVNLPGSLKIIEDSPLGNGTVDRIVLKFETKGSVIQPGTEIVLFGNDNSTVSTMGSEPSVLTEKSTKMGDKYHITLELYFRELVGTEDSYIIDLVPSRRTQIGSVGGENIERTVVLTDLESKEDSNSGTDGKDLHRNRVQIKI
ncbi:MAG: hypothetical protein ABEK36_03585 [Candidatus Aenigmatarchaeota archaeon]